MAGEMEVAKGMLRTLIKVTFGYPAIFDEVRQECQINNAHVVAGCGSGIKAFIAVVRAAEHQSEKAADQGKTH